MVPRRGERGYLFLHLVRRREGGYLAGVKVAGEAPDFLLSIKAVEHEISVFVLAVCPGTNVDLKTIVEYFPVKPGRANALVPRGDTIEER
jgi:hypothetical protein